MIEIDDEDFPNGYVRHPGLSDAESRSLNCEFWSSTKELARGCQGFGHYLCRECASLDPRSLMLTDYMDDEEFDKALEMAEM